MGSPVSRGFRRLRRLSADPEGRVPPGEYVTRGFPVLSAGPTPILVLHRDADQVPPLDKTGQRLPGPIKDVQLTVIEGGPHAVPWTHADQRNAALLGFLRR